MRVVLFLLIFMVAGPASAQRVQAHLDRDVASPSLDVDDEEAKAQRLMDDYAVCILKRNRGWVERTLEVLPMGKGRQAYVRLASSNCLHNANLKFQASLFRGSLFEALYETDFEDGAPADLVAVPAIDYTKGTEVVSGEVAKAQIALRQFADCVVRQRGADARTLVLSEVASEAEAAIFQRLTPALSGCLPENIQLTFSKPILRGLIAETAYRLSRAANATDMGGGEK